MAKRRRSRQTDETVIVLLSTIIKVVLIILMALLLYIGGIRCYQFGVEVFTDAPLIADSQDSYVIALSGDEGMLQIATTLKKYGIIKNEYTFLVQSWIFGDDIQAGEYVVGPYLSSRDILEMLNGDTEESN